MLVFDPNRRRTTVQRGVPSAPYLADLLTVRRAASEQACRLNDLPAGLTRCVPVLRMPAVAALRPAISQTLSLADQDAAGAVIDRTVGHISAMLADVVSALAASPAARAERPVSAGRRRVGLAIALMHVLHAQPAGITAICRRLNRSPRSLKFAFQECGLPSPRGCLAQIRMDHNRADLLSEQVNVTQADEAGFSPSGRFFGLYHRAFGELPAQTLTHH